MIKSLEIENFLSIEYIKADNLDQMDIIGIMGSYVGKEGYSNGSGKSAFVEAICLIMTGEHRYKTDIEAIRTDADFLRIKMFYEKDNDELSIERIMKKKRDEKSTNTTMEVRLNNEIVANSTTTGQEYINEYFGLTPKDFINSHFFRQKEYDTLLRAKSAPRIEFLQQFFESYIFDDAKKVSSTARLELIGSLRTLEGKIKLLEEKIVESNEAELESKLHSAKSRLSDLRDKLESISKNLKAVIRKHEKEQDKIKENEENREKSNELKARIETIAEKHHELRIKANHIIKKTSTLKLNLKNLQSSASLLSISVWGEKNEDRLSKAETRKEDCLVKIEVGKYNIKNKESYLKDIEAKICSNCGQKIADDFREIQKKLKEEEMRLLQGKIKKTEDIHSELLEKIQAMKKEKLVRQREEKKKILLESEIGKLEAIIKGEVDMLKAFHDQIGDLRIKKESLEKKKSLLKVCIMDNTLLNKLKVAKIKLEREQKEFSDELVEEAANQARAEEGFKEYKKIRQKLIKIKGQEKGIRQEISDRFILEDVFEKCKVETVAVGLKEIEEGACEIISQIGAVSKEIEFSTQKETQKGDSYDSLDIYLVDAKGKRDVRGLCGGEWDTTAFAIRMAMAKYKLQRMNSKVDFIVLDEVFGALDLNSRMELASCINLLRNDFKQVLTISHTDITDMFENIIELQMGKDEVTRLKEN